MNRTASVFRGVVLVAEIAAIASITFFFAQASLIIQESRAVFAHVDAEISRVDAELSHHSKALGAIEKTADGEIKGIRKDVLDSIETQFHGVLDLTDEHLSNVEGIARDAVKKTDAQLTTINATVKDEGGKLDAQLTTTNELIEKVIDPVSFTVTEFNRQFMQCTIFDPATNKMVGNSDCLKATSRAFKGEELKTADSFRKMANVAEVALTKALEPPCIKSATMHGGKRAGCLVYHHTIGPLVTGARLAGSLRK